MSYWQFHGLLHSRERAWDEAERLSDAAGFKYMDRNGVWRNVGVHDFIGIVLRRWCEEVGITYC